MKYYAYRPDANNYAGIGAPTERHEQVVNIHYEDAPLAPVWVPIKFHGFEDNPGQEGDFPSLSDFWEIPVMSERAWNALRPLIGYCCEALPIIHPTGKTYFIIHVMETIDALDVAKSDLARNATTGRVNRIRRYAFKYDKLQHKHVLKLPLECGSELLVDEEFRKAVEVHGLKGLQFKELPEIN